MTNPSPSACFQAHVELWGNGLCTAWRRQALAMHEAGVPLRLLPWGELRPSSDLALQEVRHLLDAVVTPNVWLAAAALPPSAVRHISAARIQARRRTGGRLVFIGMIERDRLSPALVEAGACVRQWWLPCQTNVEAFASSGVARERLRKVGIPFVEGNPFLSLVGRERAPGILRFYHIGSLCPRKDQTKMVLSFLRAFSPGEAELEIKVSNAYPDVVPDSRLPEYWLGDDLVRQRGWDTENVRQYVRVSYGFWEESRIVELHARSDVYVSLSHGEGWDMPAFDAVQAGNRVVYTPSGGPQEFVGDDEYLVPFSRRVRCPAVYRWESDACWADYDEADAVVAFQRAANGSLDKKHRTDLSRFTMSRLGKTMKSLLLEMSQPVRAQAVLKGPRK